MMKWPKSKRRSLAAVLRERSRVDPDWWNPVYLYHVEAACSLLVAFHWTR
jgi:hypothetical protein